MMTLTFACSGCSATAQGTRALGRTVDSINGRGYGFGSYRYNTPQDVAPDGWIAFDPYTGYTYCPQCWGEITEGVVTTDDPTVKP
jgi:hypothetical protein